MISICSMLSLLCWESSCMICSPNTTRMLWRKYISVYRGYYIGMFCCITKGRYQLNYITTSMLHNVSLFFVLWYQKYDATYTAHSKNLIALLKERNFINSIIDYNTGEHWRLCWKIYTCLCILPCVSYVAVLLSYNWSRHKCTWTQQISGRCNQCHW